MVVGGGLGTDEEVDDEEDDEDDDAEDEDEDEYVGEAPKRTVAAKSATDKGKAAAKSLLAAAQASSAAQRSSQRAKVWWARPATGVRQRSSQPASAAQSLRSGSHPFWCGWVGGWVGNRAKRASS